MQYRFALLTMAACAILAAAMVLLVGCRNPTAPDLPGDPVVQPPGPTAEPEEPVPDPVEPDPDPPLATTRVSIDFQTEVPGIVAGAFDGTGVAAEPAAGQLDANAWSILGFSDGDQEFDQDWTTGDFARGTSPGGVSSGGLYAFEVQPGNTALGIQPTSTDFAPGSITLRLTAPAVPATGCDIAFRLWSLNNEDRSSVWTALYSSDGINWTVLPDAGLATPITGDATPGWVATDLVTAVPADAPEIVAGELFYIRWAAVDGDGAGSRDEVGLDDVVVTIAHSGQ